MPVLLPLPGEPLKAKFSGPHCVKKKLNSVNYIISTPDRRKTQRVCHVNMLKKYYERDESNKLVGIAVIEPKNEKEEQNEENSESQTSDLGCLAVQLSNCEIMENLDKVLGHLSVKQRQDSSGLLKENKQIHL